MHFNLALLKMKNLLGLFLLFCQHATFAQIEQLTPDWANFKKYADSNKLLLSMPREQDCIVFMGNSITEFWKHLDTSFFSNKHFINRGISGQTSPQMLLRFQKDVIDLQPNVVVILAGINDIAENTGPISLKGILKNISAMAELAKANSIRVILSSVLPANHFPWRLDLHPAEKIIALNKMIRSYAAKNKIVYVNYYDAMVDKYKGLDKKYTEDGVHPNFDGYKIMEPLILAAISTLQKHK